MEISLKGEMDRNAAHTLSRKTAVLIALAGFLILPVSPSVVRAEVPELSRSYPAFSADDQVSRILGGYFGVSISRNESLPGNPITRISLQRKVFLKPSEKQQALEDKKPLREAFASALPHFSELKSLKQFDVDFPILTDGDLIHFQNHPSLKYLNFEFSDNLTLDGLNTLSGLKLQWIRLPKALKNASGLEILIRNLHQPESVNLSGWDVDDKSLALLQELDGVGSLELGNLPKVTDEGLAHLGHLDDLTSLKLHSLNITGSGFDFLEGLKGLKNLEIAVANVSDANLIHLRNLAELETLGIHCNQLSDQGLECLSGMPTLKTLRLSGSQVDGSGLKYLVSGHLTHLSLHCKNSTDAAADHIAKLTNLRSLSMRGSLSSEGLAKLIPLNLSDFDYPTQNLNSPEEVRNYVLAARNSTDFTLRGRPLTDEVVEAFNEIPVLKSFLVLNSKITDAGLQRLNPREEMRSLDFTGCAISDEGMKAIAERFPNVSELVIRDTQVTDAGLSHLLAMKKLDRLFIKGSKISRAKADEFARQHGSCRILGN